MSKTINSGPKRTGLSMGVMVALAVAIAAAVSSGQSNHRKAEAPQPAAAEQTH